MQHNDQPPNCYGHGLPAKKYTSHKEGTVGREFYRCSKPIGEQQCSFFQWVDNEPGTPENRVSTLPPTPASGARPASQRYSGSPSTPTSVKRNSSDTDDERAHDRKRARVTKAFGSQGSLPHTNNENTDSGWGSSWPPSTSPNNSSGQLRPVRGVRLRPVELNSQETLRDDSGQPSAMSPESIRDMIRNPDAIPEYVQKLDRKRIAAEKSRNIKKSKMASLMEQVQSLEEEVKKLKAREKQLEEVIAAYEPDA